MLCREEKQCVLNDRIITNAPQNENQRIATPFFSSLLGLIPTYPPVEGLPDIELENTGTNIGAAPENGPLNGNTYQVLDNFTLTKGRHNVKAGGEFRIVQSNERQAYASNGQFQFLGGETGIDIADYLIGTPDYFY